MDAGEVASAIRHFRSYWRPADATLTDRRVIVGLLERARYDIDDTVRRYRRGLIVQKIQVEAQDLDKGDRVFFPRLEVVHEVREVSDSPDEKGYKRVDFTDFFIDCDPQEEFEVVIDDGN